METLKHWTEEADKKIFLLPEQNENKKREGKKQKNEKESQTIQKAAILIGIENKIPILFVFSLDFAFRKRKKKHLLLSRNRKKEMRKKNTLTVFFWLSRFFFI